MLIAIRALGTDLMLPALDVIGLEVGACTANDLHYIVTAFFLGMAGGQLFAGPLSDSLDRTPVICAGYGLFILGCVICMVPESWAIMLAGRLLQGFGAAAAHRYRSTCQGRLRGTRHGAHHVHRDGGFHHCSDHLARADLSWWVAVQLSRLCCLGELRFNLLRLFCVGIIFGNLNALALEPLGQMAGLGATFLSLLLAAAIGQRFDGTVLPPVAGFAVLGVAACPVVFWTNRASRMESIG
ncbi:MFS transporter [Roseobacter weihaiensis]|uniref:MFS transporter n=1 Tax=Roseobacter weihaiensis TaxID=2763262 RepID=UPI001D0BDEA9